MSEKSAAGVQRAQSSGAPVKVVEPQTLFDRMQQIYELISRRAFEKFENEGGGPGRDMQHWLQAEAELLHPVAVNFSETDEAFTVQAEIPGFDAGELQLCLEPGRLTISGKKESREERKQGKAVYQEQSSSEVMRVIELPAAVDAAKSSATLTNGVLEIVLPKATEPRPVRADAKSA